MLFDNFIVHYGFPARIHSDQGQCFESKLLKELCQIAGVEKSRTTHYHPMGNGQLERFNQTLLKMLGTLKNHQKSDWKAHIPTLVHAYNATFHDSTGYLPFFLMIGRHLRLEIDDFLGLTPDALSAPTQTEYVRKLQERLHFAYKTATEMAKKATARDKVTHDLKARNSVLSPGDLVLVKNVSIRGKHKIADLWEHKPYVVISQPNPDIPVNEVKNTSPRVKKTRLLHRILLLPFMGLPSMESIDDAQSAPSTSPVNSPKVSVSDGYSSSSSSFGSYELSSGGSTTSDDESILSKADKTEFDFVQGTEAQQDAADPSSEDNTTRRPTRTRNQPPWMRTGDWVVGQHHVLTADLSDVVYI